MDGGAYLPANFGFDHLDVKDKLSENKKAESGCLKTQLRGLRPGIWD